MARKEGVEGTEGQENVDTDALVTKIVIQAEGMDPQTVHFQGKGVNRDHADRLVDQIASYAKGMTRSGTNIKK